MHQRHADVQIIREHPRRICVRAKAKANGFSSDVNRAQPGYPSIGRLKGLAELQLEFSKALVDLSDRMESESGKVGELRRAIEVHGPRAAGTVIVSFTHSICLCNFSMLRV